MNNNNKSDTLKQRAKAQKDLLELKKMQAGQLDPALLNDDDKKLVPKTLDEKADNFFYHNKVKIIVLGFLAVVLTVLIMSCVTKTDYDASLIIYCYEYVDAVTIEETAKWMEKLHPDTNGNSKVEIVCVDCSFSEDTDLVQTVNQQQMKLQTKLIDGESMLFILDDKSIEYLNTIGDKFTLFKEENIVELDSGYYNSLSDSRISFKEDKKRYLCLRTIDESAIKEKAKKNYEDAKKVIEKLKNP